MQRLDHHDIMTRQNEQAIQPKNACHFHAFLNDNQQWDMCKSTVTSFQNNYDIQPFTEGHSMSLHRPGLAENSYKQWKAYISLKRLTWSLLWHTHNFGEGYFHKPFKDNITSFPTLTMQKKYF